MHELANAAGFGAIGLAAFVAVAGGIAFLGMLRPGLWRWLEVLVQVGVCALPFLLAAGAAAIAYLPAEPGRAAIAVAAGSALSALLFRITWSDLRGAIRIARR